METKSGEEICLFVRDEQTGRLRRPRTSLSSPGAATSPSPPTSQAAALSFRPEPDSAKKNWRRRSAAAARRRRRVRVGLLRSSVSVRLRAL